MLYNWQLPDWPEFRYDLRNLESVLLKIAEYSGRLDGILEGLPEELETETLLELMITEAVKTSAIEGELLNPKDVMSSIRNHLGLNRELETVDSRLADGAGELMVSVRRDFQLPLTTETLFSWHRMLLGGSTRLQVGCWRSSGDPMQVVSGRIDRSTVHFEAPPADRVADEMSRFIQWFNDTAQGSELAIPQAPVRAALAHLYFESIHPFEDGNGRVGRAIAEKALSQGQKRPVLVTLSKAIEKRRNDYYAALESAQRGNEVTSWVDWFVRTTETAHQDAENQIRFVLQKFHYFQRYETACNERQLKVVRRMFDAGAEGFVGGMNARKYSAITGVSKATATRDLQQLAQLGAIVPIGNGRNTRYEPCF
jgi:Fic family protein